MKNLILIASRGNNVGKSTTAKLYSERNILTSEIYSFATPIRNCCNDIFKNKYEFDKKFTDYYNIRELKNDLIENHFNVKSFTELQGITFREFLNNFSTNMTITNGKEIWAKKALSHIEQSDNDLILIDDFRRSIEIDYLIKNLDSQNYNIITIYLIKDLVQNQVKTEYEGLLEDYKFDIVFSINNDYSNIDDLLKIIDNKII